MKVQGNQGMQQTINWVRESIDSQLSKAKDLGGQTVDRIQNALEQRLGADRFTRSPHSGLEAQGLGDLAERERASHKRRPRGRLTTGLQPEPKPFDIKEPGPPKQGPDRDPDHGMGPPVHSPTKRPDIIQVPDTNVRPATGHRRWAV